MNTTYIVRARRWSGGWELHIDNVGVTQVRTLARADQQVRDYLATLHDIDAAEVDIDIVPDLGGVEQRAMAARKRQKAAEQERTAAAREVEQVARGLRAAGLSVSETAAVLKVTRGRVSQLTDRKSGRRAQGEGKISA